MPKIVVLGKNDSKFISDTLFKVKEMSFAVSNNKNNTKYSDFVVFGDQFNSYKDLSIPLESKAIVFSQNKEALSYLQKSDVKTIVCGFSQKDTITISSKRENSTVVCLQRSIESIDGTKIEPSEYPVKHNKTKDFRILCVSAILICSGCPASLYNTPLFV